jgi:hypothetical protein
VQWRQFSLFLVLTGKLAAVCGQGSVLKVIGLIDLAHGGSISCLQREEVFVIVVVF